MKVAWTHFMESQCLLRPIKRVRQSRVKDGDDTRHQVKCPVQTPSAFPTFWKFCLTFRVSLRDSQYVTLERNASVVLIISGSGLTNSANVDLVLEWGSPLLPFTNKYWPWELFTDLEYPQAYPFPVFNIMRLSSTQFPNEKRIIKVFFSQLNLTSSGVCKVTNLMNNSRKVQSNECVYSRRSDIPGQEVWKRPDMF